MAEPRSKPRPRRLGSLRSRAAAAAALAMAAVLAAGGLWLYALLRANLIENTTGRTELAARKVAAQYDTGSLPPGGGCPRPRAGSTWSSCGTGPARSWPPAGT